jgi:hypothetical protein
MRRRYFEARWWGMPAIDAVHYAVKRRLSLRITWDAMSGFVVETIDD